MSDRKLNELRVAREILTQEMSTDGFSQGVASDRADYRGTLLVELIDLLDEASYLFREDVIQRMRLAVVDALIDEELFDVEA